MEEAYPETLSDGTLAWCWLGEVPYPIALQRQKQYVRQRACGQAPDLLVLLEHPPVITYGRAGDGPDLRLPAMELARWGVELLPTDRGGQTTYHGPGQLVGYIHCHLLEGGWGVRDFVLRLQEGIAAALNDWGVPATAAGPATGVWVGNAKIAALGLRVERGVTLHGFALNLRRTALAGFAWIIPCGLADTPVTCVENWLDLQVTEAASAVAYHVGAALGLRAIHWPLAKNRLEEMDRVHSDPLS